MSSVLRLFSVRTGKKTKTHTHTLKKTESKRQFSKSWKLTQREITIFSSTFTFLSHCSERPSWYFLFHSPLPISFSSWSLSLSDNSAWLLSNRPVQFLLVQAYNTKEYKEDWKCNYRTVSSAQAQFFRQQPPFQHSWKEKKKKVTRALLSNVIIYSGWNVLQETLIRPHVW